MKGHFRKLFIKVFILITLILLTTVVHAQDNPLPVPLYGQLNGYYCAPASAQMIYEYYTGIKSSQDYFAGKFGTTATDLTNVDNIVPGWLDLGFVPSQKIAPDKYNHAEDIEIIMEEIDAGRPIEIMWDIFDGAPTDPLNPSADAILHYSVIVGYTGSVEDFEVIVNNPLDPIYYSTDYTQPIPDNEGIVETRTYSEFVSKIWYYWTIKPKPLDLIFVIDTTGSMWDDIAQVKAGATEIINAIASNPRMSNYQIAITDFHDFPVSPYGSYSDYPYRAVLPFSNNKNDIINAIEGLSVEGGGDWPESVYHALYNAIDTQNIGDWRDGANKIVILIGDAPSHDPDVEPYYPSSINLQDVLYMAESVDPAIIFGIVIGFDPSAFECYQNVAEGTLGKFFNAPSAVEVVPAILEAIGAIGDIISTNQPPDVSGAKASAEELWPCNHKMRVVEILNVTDPDGDDVTITITGITQDEPVVGNKKQTYDAEGIGTNIAKLRAEREGNGNGRVYKITFTASDGKGGESTGFVLVGVPHDQGINSVIVDDGQIYDSTKL